ncbi:MAG: hypothetical protein OXL68_11100 [Paracoccaceae bacterium]|nr:hypothetical protein [Paracoccaceae bacterium]
MSTEFFFPGSRSRKWLRVGPLAGELDAFAVQLASFRAVPYCPFFL